MSKSLTVRVPIAPPRECSPNWRGNRYDKARAIKAARELAWFATHDALDEPGNGRLCGTPKPLIIHVVIGLAKGQKRADWDNALASVKAEVDGICDALGVNDRQVTTFSLDQQRDPDGMGFTEFVIEEQNA